MPVPAFRQVSDMRKPQEIKDILDTGNPVFVLKNSELCFVAISEKQYEEYETIKAILVLNEKLAVAEAEEESGSLCRSHDEVFDRIRKRINGI